MKKLLGLLTIVLCTGLYTSCVKTNVADDLAVPLTAETFARMDTLSEEEAMEAIVEYVEQNYPENSIEEVYADEDDNYMVMLDSGVTLFFDSRGDFMYAENPEGTEGTATGATSGGGSSDGDSGDSGDSLDGDSGDSGDSLDGDSGDSGDSLDGDSGDSGDSLDGDSGDSDGTSGASTGDSGDSGDSEDGGSSDGDSGDSDGTSETVTGATTGG